MMLSEKPAPAWAEDVTACLRGLEYDSIVGRHEIVAYIEIHGDVTDCPLVEDVDRAAINAAVCRARPTPPEPETVTELPFEPPLADRQWAVVNLDLPASTPKTRVTGRRGVNTIRDEDVLAATGCVG